MALEGYVANFKMGQQIEWSSQAGGCSKKKRGEVIAVLGPEDSINVALEFRFGKGHNIPKRAVKAQNRSSSERYLVKVLRAGDSGAVEYYAPLVRTIDGDSKSAGKLVK